MSFDLYMYAVTFEHVYKWVCLKAQAHTYTHTPKTCINAINNKDVRNSYR